MMKSRKIIIFLILLLIPMGCEKNEEEDLVPNVYLSDSFYPMNIGNYWKVDNNNYIKIVDTIRIGGELFYEFNTLVAGRDRYIKYLRIDENNDLIAKRPDIPAKKTTYAKFSSSIGDTFYTRNDTTITDCQVVVIFKNTDTIKFEYDRIYNPELKGSKYIRAYKKGFGLLGNNWKEVFIDSIIYKLK